MIKCASMRDYHFYHRYKMHSYRLKQLWVWYRLSLSNNLTSSREKAIALKIFAQLLNYLKLAIIER